MTSVNGKVALITGGANGIGAAVGEAQTNKTAPQLLPRMDAEVAALGRSTSAHTEAIEQR